MRCGGCRFRCWAPAAAQLVQERRYYESSTHRRLIHEDTCSGIEAIISDTNGAGIPKGPPDSPRCLQIPPPACSPRGQSHKAPSVLHALVRTGDSLLCWCVSARACIVLRLGWRCSSVEQQRWVCCRDEVATIPVADQLHLTRPSEWWRTTSWQPLRVEGSRHEGGTGGTGAQEGCRRGAAAAAAAAAAPSTSSCSCWWWGPPCWPLACGGASMPATPSRCACSVDRMHWPCDPLERRGHSGRREQPIICRRSSRKHCIWGTMRHEAWQQVLR